jgi:hypothetical protein
MLVVHVLSDSACFSACVVIVTEEVYHMGLVHELLTFLHPGQPFGYIVICWYCTYSSISEVFHGCGIGGIDHISPDQIVLFV